MARITDPKCFPHFEKDVLKGKFGGGHKLKEEAAEELVETKKGTKELKKMVAKKMVPKSIEREAEAREKRHESGKKHYIGHSNTPYRREVFAHTGTPTKESHPQYGHVRGPFSKKKAEEYKTYY